MSKIWALFILFLVLAPGPAMSLEPGKCPPPGKSAAISATARVTDPTGIIDPKHISLKTTSYSSAGQTSSSIHIRTARNADFCLWLNGRKVEQGPREKEPESGFIQIDLQGQGHRLSSENHTTVLTIIYTEI